jgi:HK97 family phage major capsid protein
MAFRDGSLWMSEVEAEELGAALGTTLKENFPAFLEKMVGDKNENEFLKKFIDAEMRRLLKSASTRKAPWGLDMKPLDPMSIHTIEKRLYSEPAGGDHTKADDVTKRLWKLNDELYIMSKALDAPVHSLRCFDHYKNEWSELAKALNIVTAGEGLEWIPEGFSTQMIEFVEIAAEVATLFQTITMPWSPFTFPALLDDGEAYKGGDTTSDDPANYRASTPDTDRLTFTAQKIIANYPVSDEMNEDSIVPVLETMRQSIARAVAKARDNAIINGQLTSTIDTGDTIPAYDARKLWDGLRYLTQSALKQSGSTWANDTGLALFRALREDMGVYGLMSNDLVTLANTNMINKFKSVDEVTTVEKTGAVATIIDGEIKKFDGVDIQPSQHVFENVNASGVYDGVTTTKTQYLIAYKPGFWRGNRRSFTLEMERVARKGINYMIATSREQWKAIYDTDNKPMIGWQYNITK